MQRITNKPLFDLGRLVALSEIFTMISVSRGISSLYLQEGIRTSQSFYKGLRNVESIDEVNLIADVLVSVQDALRDLVQSCENR